MDTAIDGELTLQEKEAQADNWLASSDGRRAAKAWMLRTLMVNLQIEKEEGQIRSTDPKDRSASRLSRQKFEKTAELVLMLIKELGD